MMTGAKNLVCDSNSLTMKIGRNSRSVNCVTITLTAEDLYDVSYRKISNGPKRGYQDKLIASSVGIYADMLREDFTRKTGMDTSLGRVRA